MHAELIQALRRCDMKQGCFNANCRYSVGKYFCDMDKVHKDAAAAIEALNRLVDLNTERCESLREQLRKAQEQYEKHLNELEQQLPKRGDAVELVRCRECKWYSIYEAKKDGTPDKRYSPSVCLREIYAKRRDPDWFCGDGEREVQE